MSEDEDNTSFENQIEIPIVNILIIITVIFMLIIPSMLKLNKISFIIGFIAAVLIMNFVLTFFKVLYYDNSWYTCKYQYNNSYIYKEALNDVVNDTKKGFYYYVDTAYHSIGNSLSYNNIKDNTKYVFGSIYESIKYIFSPIGRGIKSIFYGEPKSNYKTTRKKYS